MYRMKERDVIRVKVKYCDDEKEPQIKKFAIDPRLTNYDVLLGLLIKGLNIRRDFIIHYLATDDFGEQFYLPLLSDWDLDAAILTASDPILRLKVNIKSHEKVEWRYSYKLYNLSFEEMDDLNYVIDLDEWDIVVPGEAPVRLSKSNLNAKSVSQVLKQSINLKSLSLNDSNKMDKTSSNSFFNQVYQQMEKTMNSMHKVFSNTKLNETMNKLIKPPMSDIEFRNYMDNIGRIVQPEEFKQSVYLGGLEPSLRKVGWRLLLDIYPLGLTGRERLNLLEVKAKHYRSLKHSWKQKFKEGKLTEQEMAQIALVSVDVIRTDRSLHFYSGEKNQQHVAQLFDILATYCIYHPSIGYYQGMSDLASPLLFVQCEEAVAYLCFCSLMRRVSCNFIAKPTCQTSNNLNSDKKQNNWEQSGMLAKLQNLHDLLVYLDPQLAMFLREKYLGNFFFAHRWILLEMKREFNFLDSLRLLEVQWASLPHSKYVGTSSSEGVSLVENGYGDSIISSPLCPQHYTDHQFTKRPAKIRCYAVKDMSLICSLIGPQYTPFQPVSPRILISQSSSPKFSESFENQNIPENDENSDFPQSDFNESDSNEESVFTFPNHCICSVGNNNSTASNGDFKFQQKSKNYKNHSKSVNSDDCDDSEISSKISSSKRTYSNSSNHDEALIQMKDGVVELPPPEELGYGNPFLLFLCVSLLLEYREVILKGVTEASDILMLYQKFNQRHNTSNVLNRARTLYDQYLRDQEIKRRNLDEFPELELSM